ACLKVEGRVASDGSITANEIETGSESSSCQMGMPKLEEVKFFGTVQTRPPSGLSGNWMVGNQTVQVTAATEIETERGAATVGSCVEVEGTMQADNSILASQVQTEEASRCTATAANQGTFELEGVVESVPQGGGAGDWKIAGQTVRVA